MGVLSAIRTWTGRTVTDDERTATDDEDRRARCRNCGRYYGASEQRCPHCGSGNQIRSGAPSGQTRV